MKIKVEVEMFPGRKTVDVEITSDDLRTIAEKKVMDDYALDSCRANIITVTAQD